MISNKDTKAQTVATYLRVSTSEQDVELQRTELKAEIEKLGLTHCKEYEDSGISGMRGDRKALNEMLEDAKSGVFDIIMCYKIDRLSRSARIGLNILFELDKSKTKVMILKEPFLNTDAPGSNWLRQIMLMGAEMEYESIKHRTRSSKRDGIIKNKWPSAGHVSYGYKLRPDYGLEIVPDQAEVVKRIFRMYLEGNFPIRKIVAILNEEQIPSGTPNGWKKDRIQDMLHNKVYIGALPIQGKKLGFIHTFTCDPIITHESFNKIASKTKERSERSKRNADRDYPFFGYLRCSLCGYPLRSMKNGADESYSYGFTRRPSDGVVRKDKRCSGRGCGRITQKNLVEAIYNDMIKFLSTKSYEEFKKWVEKRSGVGNNDDIEAKIKQAQAELNLLNTKMDNTLEVYLDPRFSRRKDALDKVISELGPKIDVKEGMIHSLKQKALVKEEKKRNVMELFKSVKTKEMFYYSKFPERLDKLTYKDKEKSVLQSLPIFIESIHVNFPEQYLQIQMKEIISDKPRIADLDDKDKKGGNGSNGSGTLTPAVITYIGREKPSIVSALANSSNQYSRIYYPNKILKQRPRKGSLLFCLAVCGN